MKAILNVLTKVFVIQFYQSHISLFLFVLGMSAGFMRSEDHLALGMLMISSPLLATIPIVVWTLYTVILVRFNRDLLSLPENRFVYELSYLAKKQQLTSFVYAIALQLSPALLYGGFLIGLAWNQQEYLVLSEIIASLMLLTAIGTLQSYYRVRSFSQQNDQWTLIILLNRKFVKPYPLFFPLWIAQKELFVFIGTKVCALILIYGAVQLYKYDTYDVRLIGMAVVLSFAAQSHLIWNLHYFENQVLSMTRNMPLSFFERLMNLLSTLCLLLIPESAFLAGRFPEQLSFYDLVSSVSLGWSICIFIYGFLYLRSYQIDELTARIFFFAISLLVLTLSKVPLLLISTVLITAGCWVWATNYYQYEREQN